MPGLHLLISTKDILPDEKRKFMDTLSKMKHFPWYVTDVPCKDATVIIGRSYYDGYPFAVFQNEEGTTLIEGAIYNKSVRKVKRELDKISLAESSPTQLLGKVKNFLLSTQGEFIIVKYNLERQKCLIFDDALGRLPFYYSSSGIQFSHAHVRTIVMSREIKFIVPFLEETDFDRLALAESLLFGYPLGERTLWKAVKRLPPAAMMIIDARNKEFLPKKVLSWNLEPKSQAAKQSREETRKLVNLFLKSAKNIAHTFSKDYTHVVSLSGGLDSRAALAGLVKIGANPTACSPPSGELRIARKVAKTLGVEHQLISSSFRITNEEFVNLTDGLIGIRLRSFITYLYGVREKIGKRTVFYTGDGGDKTVAPIKLRPNISNVEGLLQHIIGTDHIFDLDEIGSLLSIDRNAFKEHLKKHIEAFPEKTMQGKLIHFKVFERAFKWMFLGEDKNRFLLWSTTPFYSIRFFEASMNVSQRSKAHLGLYKNFLSSLNPSLPRIRYYNRLIPLSVPNWLLRLYLSVFEWLQRHFYEQGTASPIDLLSGGRTQEGTDEMRKLALECARESQEGGFNLLMQSRAYETIKKTTNYAKLNCLARLVVYIKLARCTREFAEKNLKT